MSRFKYVIKRSGEKVPFNADRISNAIYRASVSVGGRDKALAERLSKEVVATLEYELLDDKIPQIEEIQDTVEKVLIKNDLVNVAKAYILYRDERIRARNIEKNRAPDETKTIPWKKIWETLDWSVDHEVNTLEKYNQRIKNGEFEAIVQEAEMAYSVDLAIVAEQIIKRKDQVRMVIISGPSSSGKTTTTTKIGQKLARSGLKLITMNIDHYYFDLEMHPKDEFGDYDFETPQALDLALINEHLKKLFEGEEILMPFYDFKTGKRTLNHTPMKITDNEIILIDSLYGLYPKMTGDIPAEKQYRLYLEPFLQMKDHDGKYIRWTDIRLMRRMLRDATHRSYDPKSTLTHWHYVRNAEKKNILPYINTADYIISSGMPYELSIYRHRLYESFSSWVEEFKDDPRRKDAYERALRTKKMLSHVIPIVDDSSVPGDSVIREFIGGSTLDVH